MFEFAHKGTLFLDEVEGMSQAMQVKLLRLLQEQEVMRVGGNQIIYVDVRIVAATNESLEEKVEDGSFRRDLYYRLNALPVLIPPLRERGDDILLLLKTFRVKSGGQFTLSEEVLRLILDYSWPGNIRELQNVVEYLSFTGQDEIKVEDLPPTFVRPKQREGLPGETEPGRKEDSRKRGSPGCCSGIGGAGAATSSEVLPEGFWFVLEQLYRASQENRMIGREGVLKAARDSYLPLSQKEIRAVLGFMAERGIAKVSKGRGGSRITPTGRNIWENQGNLTK